VVTKNEKGGRLFLSPWKAGRQAFDSYLRKKLELASLLDKRKELPEVINEM
jgi:hypothetical protein